MLRESNDGARTLASSVEDGGFADVVVGHVTESYAAHIQLYHANKPDIASQFQKS